MLVFQAMFGRDIQILQDGVVIGTKDIGDYDVNVDDDTLARDPDLDLNSCMSPADIESQLFSHSFVTQL